MYKIPAKKLIFLRIITCVIIVFALISTAIAGFFVVYNRTYVKGLSMYPILNSKYEQTNKRDVIYINRFAKTKKGDIIVLDLREHNVFMNYAVKRLIATEGDIVNITFDIDKMEYYLIVNGEIVETKQYQNLGYNTYSCFNQYVSNHKADSSRISKNNQDEVDGVIVKTGEIFGNRKHL